MCRFPFRVALIVLTVLAGARVAPAEKRAARDPLGVAADIDRAIDRHLAAAGVPAAPAADDGEFLRRVSLDLTGRIPTLERTLAFLDDSDPDKRRRLIDQFLASRDYGQHLATVWRNRLAPPSPVSNKPQRDVFTPCLADQLNRNRGWHEIVSDLLTVEGDIAKTPQSAFVTTNSDNFQPKASLLAASAARLFLGVQLQCAECHDHPFAPWKQTDFWATAAFFGRLRNSKKGPPFILTEQQEPGSAPGPAAITLPSGTGRAAGQIVKARFLGGAEPAPGVGPALRPAFAAWLTAPDNRYFAPAFVNRTWAGFFGRGLVNPVDDFRDDNPPSHPEVLKLLADEARASGFDLKHLARCVCNSRAYQRTGRAEKGHERDAELFGRAAARPLSPEAFYDSLTTLYAPSKSGKFAASGTAAPRLEARDDFVRFFRAQGEAAAEGGINQGIPQFLRRLNGEAFGRGSPLVAYLVRKDVPTREAIELLYLATLSRRPAEEEVELLTGYLGRRKDAAEGYAGVQWILLNTGEFVLNH
jgi:hypothetical protein